MKGFAATQQNFWAQLKIVTYNCLQIVNKYYSLHSFNFKENL
jgi:hypothetical protein